MAKPVLLLTRKLPEAIEARASRDYDARLNPQDEPWATDGAEIARRARAAGAAGVFGAAGDQLNAACINALPDSVKVIATFSVGFDHIDIAAAKARSIAVVNTPEVLSFATAECAFTLMLMAARRAGEGERILGFGRIGRELAAMARGFRMEIHYRDIQKLPPEIEQGAIYHDNEDSFLGAIDIISMHVPGGEANRHWLNAARLAKMKQGSVVVNSGRGVSVHDESLIAALTSGHIRAAGLDVYDGEPMVNPGYFALENVALLPHLGSATIEVRDAMGNRALENLDAVLLHGTAPPHRVA
jgi:lactate dehydrogenase-like 2-hydroxyacid dehydrogenase